MWWGGVWCTCVSARLRQADGHAHAQAHGGASDEGDLAREVEELRPGAAVEAGVARGGPRAIGRGGGGGLLSSGGPERRIGCEEFSDGWPGPRGRVQVPREVRDAACRARVRWRRLGLRKRAGRVCSARDTAAAPGAEMCPAEDAAERAGERRG